MTADSYREYLAGLDRYFSEGSGPALDKLWDFPKYAPRSALLRFLVRFEIFKQVLDVQGSVVECGVFRGGGLLSWAQFSAILEPANHQRRVIGFDTFAGFPSLAEQDSSSTSDHARVGGLASERADVERAVELYDLTRFLNHIPKVELVEGDLAETVPAYLEANPHLVVSLLNLDVDLFEPTAIALRHFLPRMPKGAVVVLDEANQETFPGETLALLQEIGLSNVRLRRLPFGSAISYAVIE